MKKSLQYFGSGELSKRNEGLEVIGKDDLRLREETELLSDNMIPRAEIY